MRKYSLYFAMIGVLAIPAICNANLPAITEQPANQTNSAGTTAVFSVTAQSSSPLIYQWLFNSTNIIPSATNSVLILTNVQPDQAGSYEAMLSNDDGSTNSSIATLTVYSAPVSLFFDDFTGPTLNPLWTASLPDAYCGSFPNGFPEPVSYVGAPNFGFQTIASSSVIRLTNTLAPLQRCGWSSATNFVTGDFRYDVRFNTLVQSPATSIDGFIEIWIIDAANSGSYDIISPFGGSYDAAPEFFVGSTIDGSFNQTPIAYTNNTWYHLVLAGAPGQNIRASFLDDNGTELAGQTLAHGAEAYSSGFQIALSQAIGNPGSPYPVDVAVDYVSLTSGAAPVISSQPANQVVASGGTASFNVTASGSTPLNYQWSFNGTSIIGATNATLILSNIQAGQSGAYSVEVVNSYGAAFSSNATLNAGAAPAINSQPFSQTVAAGGTASFSVDASGALPLGYQWEFSGVPIAGATNASLQLTNVQFAQTGNYSVSIANAFGAVLSSNATLTVQSSPFLTSQPVSAIVLVGGTVTFTATASGSPPLAYLWTFNGTNLSGATNTTLLLTNVQLSQAGDYVLTVSNAYGGTFSSNAVLTVNGVKPAITSQPTSQTVISGGTANFNVSASGTAPFTYQWEFNGNNITGATNSSLALANIQTSQAGNYWVVVSNAFGTATSSNAALTVGSPLVSSFFDDFAGPNLNPIWQTNLPNNAHSGSFPYGYSQTATYLGAPNFSFQTLNGSTILRLTNSLAPLQRRGWGSLTNFGGTNFYYEARFNTLNQSPTTSIDGFIEIWIMDAANSNRYDTVSLFGGDYDGSPTLFWGSSIDNSYQQTSFTYSNYTWYRIVLQCAPGQNMRASILSDAGTELIGQTFSHSGSAYASGFKIGFSQLVGGAGATYPVDVAIDYVSLSTSLSASPPVITAQPTNLAVAVGGTASFGVAATSLAPLNYQWNFNGTNINGATNTTLTLTNVQLASAGNYSVTVSNGAGSTNSVAAALTVVSLPLITQQPQSQTVLSYSAAVFSVAATGTGPLAYQWQKNGVNLVDNGNIIGSTSSNLVLASVSLGDAGSYSVVVSSPYAATNSIAAILTVPQTLVSLGTASAMSGSTVTVPVIMNALGVENTFLASVGYDPAKLVLKGVQLGQATAGAYLEEVDNQTNNGYVGFAILLNAGLTIPAGTQQVANVVFQTLPVTNNTTVNLTFGDIPTGRELVDNNLDSLPALYQSGSVTLSPAEYEADVYPRTNGDSQVNIFDWLEVGRMVAGLDVPTNSDEFRRADCAPRNAPDGVLTVADWVQAGRYALGLDPLTLVDPPATASVAAKAKPHGAQGAIRILQVATVSAQRGQTVNVPVQLVCITNENAVGLTISYQTNQLKLLNVLLGSATTRGRLNINSNQPGKVGLALALSPGATLVPGTNQVALLQFTAGTNASGTASLTLDGSVIQLEVADLLANSLASASVNGAVTLPPQPAVAVTGASGKLQLSWPLATGTYQVQTSASPSGPWTAIILPVVTNGATATVTVSSTNQQQYFRLQGQ